MVKTFLHDNDMGEYVSSNRVGPTANCPSYLSLSVALFGGALQTLFTIFLTS